MRIASTRTSLVDSVDEEVQPLLPKALGQVHVVPDRLAGQARQGTPTPHPDRARHAQVSPTFRGARIPPSYPHWTS
jgi:hypothetical protein